MNTFKVGDVVDWKNIKGSRGWRVSKVSELIDRVLNYTSIFQLDDIEIWYFASEFELVKDRPIALEFPAGPNDLIKPGVILEVV